MQRLYGSPASTQQERDKWVDKLPTDFDDIPALIPCNVVLDDKNSNASSSCASDSVGEDDYLDPNDIFEDAPSLPPEGDTTAPTAPTASAPTATHCQRCPQHRQWGRDACGCLKRIDNHATLSLGPNQQPAHAYRLSHKRRIYRQRLHHREHHGT